MRSRFAVRTLAALLVLGLLSLSPAALADWSFETLDGDGGATGQVTTSVGVHNTVLLYNGRPHVWYQDWQQNTLRHAWWTGSAWYFETLDGAGGPNGRVNDSVGQWSSAVLYAGQPHVFYMQGDDPVVDAKLRHAWWTGSTWMFETLDGNGGANGRTSRDVGAFTSTVLYGGTPHVWYHDEDDGALRHAWWTGATWYFETLDGLGGPNGRIARPVGEYTTVVVYGGGPHVWYTDFFPQSMRHGWWTGSTWMFETLDGVGGVWGGTTRHVGTWRDAALYGGTPHVWYRDDDAEDLRHAWWTGAAWYFEALDGTGGPNGETTNDVGTYPSVVEYAGGPHVFYADADDEALRHGWWDGATWWFETLDGNGGPSGQTTFAAGGWTASVLYAGQPHVWYTEAAFSMFNLRHGWWTP